MAKVKAEVTQDTIRALELARKYIEVGGLVKGQYYDKNTNSYCLLGALNAAVVRMHNLSHIPLLNDSTTYHRITEFSDLETTTKEDVIRVLTDAIKLAERELNEA